VNKPVAILLIAGLIALCTAFSEDESPSQAVRIAPEPQRSGDSAAGYKYLTTGDFLKSGVPHEYFILKNGEDTTNYLRRTGENADVGAGYNVVKAPNGVDVVIPTCLQCHAQVFDGKLVIGLGNTFMDFTNAPSISSATLEMMQHFAPKKYRASKLFFQSYLTVHPLLKTQVVGVNAADRLAAVLVAHRNPQTLVWNDTALMPIPDQVIPTDVPPWWLLKKKNGMFYNGFGRGDFARFLMASNLLTVTDTAEASEVDSHFGDVLAYLKTLTPPKYPKPINTDLAQQGQIIFQAHCSRCHGTYGDSATYPNLLIPESIVGTDSMLFKGNQQAPQFVQWFNQSWFAQGAHPARLVPFNGYIAPPLDGIWITAPYFHNGSVPTLEAVLNSKSRPTYWRRNFHRPEYDYEKVGWQYQDEQKAIGFTDYNTTLPGYGNYGHTFGDLLTDAERNAVIEYLKTL
jgi:mono/diheme cytochrome c family protein